MGSFQSFYIGRNTLSPKVSPIKQLDKCRLHDIQVIYKNFTISLPEKVIYKIFTIGIS